MSHSKCNRRGHSFYVESRNPAAKKYINACLLCGTQGYSPALDAPDFDDDNVRRIIHAELSRTMKPLPLDRLGRCDVCAARQDASEAAAPVRKEMELRGCIEIPADMTLDEFTDAFIALCEERGWCFGGGFREIVNGYYIEPDGSRGAPVGED